MTQAGEMANMYPETIQCQLRGHFVLLKTCCLVSTSAILSDEETTSELSALSSTTLHSPLENDVTDYIKAMIMFEAEAAPDAISIS